MQNIISKTEAKKLESWLASAQGKKLLFYHNDADGIASACMLLKFFRGFENDVRRGPVMDNRFVKDIIDKKPELLVFVDLPVDQEWKKLEKIQKRLPGLRVVVIDHHLYEKNLNSERVLHINPRFKLEAYIPASAVVYEALKRMGRKIEPLLWIAAIGVIGDYGFEDCRDLINKSRQMYPKLLGKNPLASKFWSAAELISGAVTLNNNSGARKCLGFLLESKNFEEFVSVPELGGWKREVDEEFDRVIKNLEHEKEEYPNGILAFEINTRLGLNSAVAGYFSEKYPDTVTIIRRNVGKQQWKLSLRCQSGRVNVGEVSKKAVKGIGSGGGHVKAAGAMVNDWDRFVKRFVKLAGQSK